MDIAAAGANMACAVIVRRDTQFNWGAARLQYFIGNPSCKLASNSIAFRPLRDWPGLMSKRPTERSRSAPLYIVAQFLQAQHAIAFHQYLQRILGPGRV